MIQAPDELRSVAVGATVNLFVSVGQTSRRLKGTVDRTRERGSADEVLEVHVSESTPGESEIVFWLGFTDEGTYLLPMDGDGEALVYATYKHGGGKTGLYVDSVREVDVRAPATDGEATASEDGTASEDRTLDGDATTGADAGSSGTRAGGEGFPDAGGNELGSATPERGHGARR